MDKELLEQGLSADESFAAGLADSPLTDTPAVQRPEEDEAAKAEAAAKVETPEPEPKKELTDIEKLMLRTAELEGATQKQLDKAFGTIGALTQKLADLQGRGNGSVDLSPEKFKRLKELGFDDLTEALSGDLRDAIGTATSHSSVDSSAIETKVREEVRKEVQLDLLDEAYEDWRERIAKPEFQAFVAGKPAEWQKEFNTTWKASFVKKAISEFDRAAAAAAEAAKTPAPPPPRPNRQRFEDALTPKGSGGNAGPQTKDPFLEGLGLA